MFLMQTSLQNCLCICISYKLWQLLKPFTSHLTNTESNLVCLRMIFSMSNQVSELKMMLSTSSEPSLVSGPFAGDDRIEFTSSNSESSSSESDFTFPAPAPTSPTFYGINPSSFQLIVQDISAADVSGQFQLLSVIWFPLQCIHINPVDTFHSRNWVANTKILLVFFIGCFLTIK